VSCPSRSCRFLWSKFRKWRG